MPSSVRTVPEAPRFAALWAALAYAAATLALGFPALAGRFLVTPISDQYLGGYPVREFAARMFHATGSIPLWNPYLFGGMPYVASMNGDMFYPTFVLRLILGPDVGMTWGMILHLFLAGYLTYWFLRTQRLSFGASLVGGMAYMMAGQVASLVSPGHDGKLFISALFPLTLMVITWGMRDGKQWAWGVLALVSGLGVLTPHPQLYQYLLLSSGAWALFLAFGGDGSADRKQTLTRLGAAFGAIILGMCIGAIQFVPVFEYVAWSPRAAGKGYDYATSYSMPIEEILNTYLPQFTGILDHYWGRNGIHFHSEYLGAAVLFLAGAGIGGMQRKARWFWLGTLVVSLLWALGGNTPFYHLVYALVPGSKFFRAPSTIFFVTTFAVAMFAAYGAERLLRGEISRKYVIGWAIAGAVITLLAMSGGLASAFAPMEAGDRVEANQGALTMGAIRSLIFLALAMGLALAAARQRLSTRAGVIALTALVAIDAWTIQRLYWNFSAPAKELYASNAIVEHIRKEDQTEPGRVFALYGEGAAPHDPYLSGDAFMIHGVRLVLGYHGNQLGRYDRLYDKDGGGRSLANPAFWQLANMKWFVGTSAEAPLPGAQHVMGPVTDAAGSPLHLFRMPGDNPPAWVVPVMMKLSDTEAEQALHDPRFPVKSLALFDTAAAVQGAVNLSAVPTPLTLATKTPTYEPGHIVVELGEAAPAGSALVVSENYYPGWTATIDGQPAPVYRVNLTLMGVPLKSGAKRVELRFDSASYHRGRLITFLAIGAALLAIVGGAVLARQGRGGAAGLAPAAQG